MPEIQGIRRYTCRQLAKATGYGYDLIRRWYEERELIPVGSKGVFPVFTLQSLQDCEAKQLRKKSVNSTPKKASPRNEWDEIINMIPM